MTRLIATLLLLSATLLPAASLLHAETEPFDVVVYGGTPAGITASIQARRMGKTAVLIEPSRHLGGLTSGGLGATDIGNKQAIGGLSREFYARIHHHYADEKNWTLQTRDDYAKNPKTARYLDNDVMWAFEPKVAEQTFRQMLVDADVTVVTSERLDLKHGVTKSANRIDTLRMESGRTFAGKMFVDATYEGDLMPLAGVSFTVGREANAQYNETLNGVQLAKAKYHQFINPVDPYIIPGDKSSGLLFGINPDPLPPDGTADRKVQAYCFRFCTTNVPENRRPWPKPADYDEKDFELLLRNCETGDKRIPWSPHGMPNGKTDTNNNFAVSTDYIGQNYDYPEADYATREKIWKAHERYQKGLMWTLANHPRVSPEMREVFQTWALPKDEFVDNDNWPHQLYIREARRMVSAVVMTEHHCKGRETIEDSVGLGAYGMDSHHIQRHVDAQGHVRNEGDVQVKVPAPYPISYRAIIPREEECQNLLVPVCLSATHISYGSIRMEPVFMILGQSSGTAASLSIDNHLPLQQLPYQTLRPHLEKNTQILTWIKK